MARDLPTFRMLFPELTTTVVADDVVTFWLTRAENRLDPETWGDCYDDGVLYWTAHNIALANAQGSQANISGASGAGVIASASVDSVSTSFAVPKYATDGTPEETLLARSLYGQQFLALRDTCFSGGRIAGTRAATFVR